MDKKFANLVKMKLATVDTEYKTVEELWKKFKEAIGEATKEECGKINMNSKKKQTP